MALTASVIVPIRIYAVRTLIATSLLSIVLFIRSAVTEHTLNFAPYWEALWVPLILITTLHHALAVLKFKFMYNVIDLTLLAAEVAGLVYGFCHDYKRSVVSSLPIAFSPHAVILAIMCIDRIFLAIKGLWRDSAEYFIKTVCLVPEKQKLLWRSRWQIICGRHLLSSHLLGETTRVIVPRLILAYIALLSILGYIYFIIIERPWRADQVWAKQKTIPFHDSGDLYGHQNLSLAFALDRYYCNDNTQGSDPLFSVTYVAGVPIQKGVCEEHYFHNGPWGKRHLCPFISGNKQSIPSLPATTIQPQNLRLEPRTTIFDVIPPTIVVTHDFTCATETVDEVDISFEMANFGNATEITMPIRLTRGGHDVVSYTLDFWEDLDYGESPSFWRLLNPKIQRYPVIREVSRSPDTTLNGSAYGPNIGSLRLKKTRTGVVFLHQQVPKSDAVDSFASVGGLWTLLNGIFLIICGRNLLDVLIGQRPLSAVGWLHFFDRKRIQAAARVNYPHVQADQADAGLPALIADHFVDMGPAMEKPGHLAPRRYPDLDTESPRGEGGEDDSSYDAKSGMLKSSESLTRLPLTPASKYDNTSHPPPFG